MKEIVDIILDEFGESEYELWEREELIGFYYNKLDEFRIGLSKEQKDILDELIEIQDTVEFTYHRGLFEFTLKFIGKVMNFK